MIQKLKGTRDILPEEIKKWQYIEEIAKSTFEKYGYEEIRVPVIEKSELFQRGVGEDTDVVQKEMYIFDDKGGRSVALRPEGTAGVVRSYIENGMSSKPSPIKLWYAMPMYRYENVQKGRQREFNQIGVELLGSGRYDGLVEELGGEKTPAIGFATGVERLIDVFDKNNPDFDNSNKLKLFVAYIGEEANLYVTKLVSDLRKKGIYVEKDIMDRSLNAQFKYANKKNAEYVITIGEQEINTGKVELKEMNTGNVKTINIEDIEKSIF